MKENDNQEERKSEVIAAPISMPNYFFLNPVVIEAHKSQYDGSEKFSMDDTSPQSSEVSNGSPAVQ